MSLIFISFNLIYKINDFKRQNIYNNNLIYILAVFENLLAEKQIPGTLTDRIGNSCTYVPNIHTKTLNNWVMNFYINNNYLGI